MCLLSSLKLQTQFRWNLTKTCVMKFDHISMKKISVVTNMTPRCTECPRKLLHLPQGQHLRLSDINSGVGKCIYLRVCIFIILFYGWTIFFPINAILFSWFDFHFNGSIFCFVWCFILPSFQNLAVLYIRLNLTHTHI